MFNIFAGHLTPVEFLTLTYVVFVTGAINMKIASTLDKRRERENNGSGIPRNVVKLASNFIRLLLRYTSECKANVLSLCKHWMCIKFAFRDWHQWNKGSKNKRARRSKKIADITCGVVHFMTSTLLFPQWFKNPFSCHKTIVTPCHLPFKMGG